MGVFERTLLLMGVTGLWAAAAQAQVAIDNGLQPTDIGYWAVNVDSGGESTQGNLTAVGTPSGTVFEATNIIFQLHSFVDVGTGGFRLSESPSVVTSGPTLVNSGPGTDIVTSSGYFPGDSGQIINWTVTSSIEDGSVGMTSAFEFSAEPGETLGELVLYQYLDEDVLNFFDDVFFVRGTAADGDLELFTVDDGEAIGISHGGALNTAQGLVNATFLGWAACVFNKQVPAIRAGTLTVSPEGELCFEVAEAAFEHPVVGAAYGPLDAVSVLAWKASASASTITTSTGGVPTAPLPETFVPDHYLTYDLKKAKGEEKFDKFEVFLADQFQADTFTVEKREELGNPVDKNGEGIADPDTHLVSYKVKQTRFKGDPKDPEMPIEGIQVTDQFFPDGLVLNVKDINKADRLLVPAGISLSELPSPPSPESEVDHFLCYKVELPDETEFPEGLQAELADQFIDPEGIGLTELFDIKKPKRLCNPVNKNDEGIMHEENHLICYDAKAPRGEGKSKEDEGKGKGKKDKEKTLVNISDQFGAAADLEVKKEKQLCVPAEITLPEA